MFLSTQNEHVRFSPETGRLIQFPPTGHGTFGRPIRREYQI
jgi:hypothetical protein